MSFQFALTKEQNRDLQQVFELPLSDLEKAREVLASGTWKSPITLQKSLSEVVGGEGAESLVKVLVALRTLSRQTSVNLRDLLENFAGAIDRLDWDAKQKSQFAERRLVFLDLLSSKPVEFVSKILSLSYEHANLLQGAQWFDPIP